MSETLNTVSYTHLDVYKRQVEKFAKTYQEKNLSITNYNNILFMGSNVISGSATAVVIGVGNNTLFGSIASSVSTTPMETNFTKGVNSVSRCV